jgi:HD superfamily phosphohydrolase
LTQKRINKLKIFNDPIYGFITIPSPLIFDLIAHPYFQRLRRISQMGLSNLVYPGANHSRFHHALGCLHLMQRAIKILRDKGVDVSKEEENAVFIAILLHDIGHGPYSHALEHSIVTNTSHEQISLIYMNDLNKEFHGELDLAIAIFKGTYKRQFLNQLIASQLDIDRLDYLKRDSFYTGVSEGNINSERLITMLNVRNDLLVVDQKGIYSVENFLIGRRLMYWQVYLHKTALIAEKLMIRILKRARMLLKIGELPMVEDNFYFFLNSSISFGEFDKNLLDRFASLDDHDVFYNVKQWCFCKDKILASLSKSLVERRLPKVKIQSMPFEKNEFLEAQIRLKNDHGLNEEESSFFLYEGKVENQAYNTEENQIKIQFKNGDLKDITEASDHLNLYALSKPVEKHYFAYARNPF